MLFPDKKEHTDIWKNEYKKCQKLLCCLQNKLSVYNIHAYIRKRVITSFYTTASVQSALHNVIFFKLDSNPMI